MNNISVTARPTISKRQRLGRELWRDKWLYVMLIPGIVFFLLFKLNLYLVCDFHLRIQSLWRRTVLRRFCGSKVFQDAVQQQ